MRWGLFALLVGGGAIAVIALSERSSTSAKGSALGYPNTKRAHFEPQEESGSVAITFDGKPLPKPSELPRTVDILGSPSEVPTQAQLAKQAQARELALRSKALQTYDAFLADIHTEWARRRKTLPASAQTTLFVDEWSDGLYSVPGWWVLGGLPEGHVTREVVISQGTGVLVDGYGRMKPGQYGIHASLWDATIGGLLKNPLGQFALWAAVLYFGGPAGLALYGSYALWQSRGSEFSLQDTAIAAARAAVVAECGPGCGVAFDMGVGVLQGKRVDHAAEDALIGELTPEQRAAYEQGKAAYEEVRAA